MTDEDKRMISMPLAIYHQDIKEAEKDGRMQATNRLFKLLKSAKEDPRDAVLMVVETFDGDQLRTKQMLDVLGLTKVAEEMWGK
jgi:hypothetical protein